MESRVREIERRARKENGKEVNQKEKEKIDKLKAAGRMHGKIARERGRKER